MCETNCATVCGECFTAYKISILISNQLWKPLGLSCALKQYREMSERNYTCWLHHVLHMYTVQYIHVLYTTANIHVAFISYSKWLYNHTCNNKQTILSHNLQKYVTLIKTCEMRQAEFNTIKYFILFKSANLYSFLHYLTVRDKIILAYYQGCKKLESWETPSRDIWVPDIWREILTTGGNFTFYTWKYAWTCGKFNSPPGKWTFFSSPLEAFT